VADGARERQGLEPGLVHALSAGVMGFILPGVDNAAHVGRFAGGYLAGLLDHSSPSVSITSSSPSFAGKAGTGDLVPIVRAVVAILL
jgi:hypothetical protein